MEGGKGEVNSSPAQKLTHFAAAPLANWEWDSSIFGPVVEEEGEGGRQREETDDGRDTNNRAMEDVEMREEEQQQQELSEKVRVAKYSWEVP